MASRQMKRIQERGRTSAQKQRAVAQRKKAAERRKKEQVKKGVWERITQFLREVRAELKKVIWPSRDDVVSYTIVVLVTVTFITTFILLLDLVFTKLLQYLY